MKKVYLMLFALGMISMVACGPSAEDKAKMEAEEKAKMDSIFNASNQKMEADSMASAAPAADSTAAH